jgi:ribosomal protein S18 acetylase RimI-like enzyme
MIDGLAESGKWRRCDGAPPNRDGFRFLAHSRFSTSQGGSHHAGVCFFPHLWHAPPRMTIRPAVEADIPLLRTLADRIWRECYPGIITLEQIEFMLAWMYSEEQIRRELAEGTAWDLAEHDRAPIGFLSYELDDDRRVKLHKLYLLPEHQGRGHAKSMLDHVFARARALGGHEVWLQVNKRNTRAIAAYRKAGFHVAKEAVFEIGAGFVMDDYLMAKAVA